MQTGKSAASWAVPLIVLLGFVAGTNELAGQQAGGASVSLKTATDRSWPSVNLNVVVLDKERVPQKVDEREFQLFEDGAERALQFPGSPDSPVSLGFVIDTSGSIFKRKDAVVAAVKAIVKAVPDGSEVAVVDFTDKAYIDLSFTSVSKADLSFLDRLHASGPTALYDAVAATEDYIITYAKYARRALVVLSDGEDNASHISRRAAFGKMERPGAPVLYACVPSKANILQSELMAGHINMRFLAKWGGGAEFNLDPDPEAAAAQIADDIRNQYALQFTAADPARNGRARKVTVRLPVEDVQIHALPVYFAPAK